MKLGRLGSVQHKATLPVGRGHGTAPAAGYTHGSSQTRIDFKYKKVTTSYQPLPPPLIHPRPQDGALLATEGNKRDEGTERKTDFIIKRF